MIDFDDRERYNKGIRKFKRSLQAALGSVGFTREWLPSLIQLLRRDWWARAWIRQELTLSKNPQILCGRKAIGWDNITAGLVFISAVGEQMAEELAMSGLELADSPGPSVEFVTEASAYAMPLIGFRDRYRLMDGKSLYAKDRIWPLLGLPCDVFPQDPNGPRIDFGDRSTAEEVFTTITKALIISCWHEPSAPKNYDGVQQNTSQGGRAGALEASMFHALMYENYSVPQAFLASGGENVPDFERRERFVSRYIEAIHKDARGRRPVVSEGNRIGLVPAETRKGDKLVVLLGATVPVGDD
ncbi:hypothetical protein ACJ41O_014404 [Fusarium nematophilum]